jgi:uncharacterized protein involved in exopolysaccharide biosynthesis
MSAFRQDGSTVIDYAAEAASLFPPDTEALGSATTTRRRLAARLIWDERRRIARVVSYGATLSLLIALLVPATFESQMRLMPSPQQGTRMTIAGIPTAISSGGFNFGSSAMFVRLMTSDAIRDELIDRHDLKRVYGTKTYRSARNRLSRNTRFADDWKTGSVTVTVSDRDPQRAAAIAGSYLEELNRLMTDLNTSAAHRERVFLEDRLKKAKRELDASARAFSEFSSKITAVDIQGQEQALLGENATLQRRAIAAESELRGMEQIYTRDNPRARSAQARLAELYRQLGQLSGSASTDPLTASSSQPLYPSLRQLPKLGVPYTDLFRQLRTDETIYEVLTQECELARVREAREVPGIVVVDAPQPAEKRSGPSRLLILVGGAFFSLCTACTWVYAKEIWDCTDRRHRWRMLVEEVAATIHKRLQPVTTWFARLRTRRDPFTSGHALRG